MEHAEPDPEGRWIVRELYETWGLSLSAIARACGASREHISRIYNGEYQATGRYKLPRLRRLYEAVSGKLVQSGDGTSATPAPYLTLRATAPVTVAPQAPAVYVPPTPSTPSTPSTQSRTPTPAPAPPLPRRADPRPASRPARRERDPFADVFALLAARQDQYRQQAQQQQPAATPAATPSPPATLGIATGPYGKCERCGGVYPREQLRTYREARTGARGVFCGQACADAWVRDLGASGQMGAP